MLPWAGHEPDNGDEGDVGCHDAASSDDLAADLTAEAAISLNVSGENKRQVAFNNERQKQKMPLLINGGGHINEKRVLDADESAGTAVLVHQDDAAVILALAQERAGVDLSVADGSPALLPRDESVSSEIVESVVERSVHVDDHSSQMQCLLNLTDTERVEVVKDVDDEVDCVTTFTKQLLDTTDSKSASLPMKSSKNHKAEKLEICENLDFKYSTTCSSEDQKRDNDPVDFENDGDDSFSHFASGYALQDTVVVPKELMINSDQDFFLSDGFFTKLEIESPIQKVGFQASDDDEDAIASGKRNMNLKDCVAVDIDDQSIDNEENFCNNMELETEGSPEEVNCHFVGEETISLEVECVLERVDCQSIDKEVVPLEDLDGLELDGAECVLEETRSQSSHPTSQTSDRCSDRQHCVM